MFLKNIFLVLFSILSLGFGNVAASSASKFKISSLSDSKVYAKVGDFKVTGRDVKSNIKKIRDSLGMYGQIFPEEALFYMTTVSLVEKHMFEKKIKDSKIEQEPEIADKIVDAKYMILRGTLTQRHVDKHLNEAKIKAQYKKYLAEFEKNKSPNEMEIRVKHILVKDEGDAQLIVDKLGQGMKFENLAKNNSIDPGSKNKGGDLGAYIRKNGQFDKDFLKAAFAIKSVGDYTLKPIKSRFGWHVIKLVDKRLVLAPSLEKIRKEVSQMAKRDLLDSYTNEITKGSKYYKTDGKTSVDPKKEMEKISKKIMETLAPQQ